MNADDYPYKAEYAKSGRASCKKCKNPISKESLRLAKMIQSPHFDGKIPNWYHVKCFWSICKVPTHTDIAGFASLRWEHQEEIKKSIEEGADKGKSAGDGVVVSDLLENFAVEYAKSGRSACKACDEKIGKDEIRISKRDMMAAAAKGVPGPLDMWHHVDCFCKKERLDELHWPAEGSANGIPGFPKLKPEDQKILEKKLGKRKTTAKDEGPPPKKSKSAASSSGSSKASKEEEALKKQSKFLWGIRDELFKSVSNVDLKDLLTANNQDIPSGESKLLDRVADGMAFGALEPCTVCSSGQLIASSSGIGYKCTGNISGWTKCQNVTKEAKRKPWVIPDEFLENDYLKTFKFKAYNKGVRLFPPKEEVVGPSKSHDRASSSKPLENCSIVIVGKLGLSNKDMKAKIQELGGKVSSSVSSSLLCVISNAGEVEKKSKKIADAEKCNVHVVSEDFLEAVKKGGAALLVTQHSIAGWGSDPHSRIGSGSAGAPHKSGKAMSAMEAQYVKSVPKTMKMTIKGGGAVDAESGLSSVAHVLKDNGQMYAATLGMVDITRGSNSFYLLQVLQSDTSKRYWVFRKWGRVGTTIGGNKLESFGSDLADAKTHFRGLYLEKTGNGFGTKNFKKHPHKFYPLDIDYGEEEDKLKQAAKGAGSTSKLPKEIQEIIMLIFDIEQLKKTMMEFEIDMDKMPLGKLSRKQIKSAYSVLTELQSLIGDDSKKTQILDASNRFYTLIPHNFGLNSIPMLDNPEIIKLKTNMLDNLLEIEVAYSLLKSDSKDDGSKDQIDVHYENLKCVLEVVDKKSKEFKMIKDYTKNSHAATHNTYSLKVEEVFRLDRTGEASRYKPFNKLHNRRLLWHGSRVTNYAGILSQGLRIAPPEAPVTGYMFGKGVYFADMVSKSANYCHTSYQNSTGLMLLCEAALGEMYELTGAQGITKLPAGKHSTFGMGRTGPDPTKMKVLEDGLQVPLGKGMNTAVKNSSLLYNEFIVYDVAQVKMKYLIKMKFEYKQGGWW